MRVCAASHFHDGQITEVNIAFCNRRNEYIVQLLSSSVCFLSSKRNRTLRHSQAAHSRKETTLDMMMKTFFACVLLTLTSALPSAPEARDQCTGVAADTLVFDVPMAQFLDAKAAKNPACFDWSDDGCSCSPDKPDWYNFLPACYRHDFGYKNNKALGRFSAAKKLDIDNNFKVLPHVSSSFPGTILSPRPRSGLRVFQITFKSRDGSCWTKILPMN